MRRAMSRYMLTRRMVFFLQGLGQVVFHRQPVPGSAAALLSIYKTSRTTCLWLRRIRSQRSPSVHCNSMMRALLVFFYAALCTFTSYASADDAVPELAR